MVPRPSSRTCKHWHLIKEHKPKLKSQYVFPDIGNNNGLNNTLTLTLANITEQPTRLVSSWERKVWFARFPEMTFHQPQKPRLLSLIQKKGLYSENGCTHCSDLFKMTDVTAHQEGCRSHEEVQHSSCQHGNIGLLPGQRLREVRGTEDRWRRRIRGCCRKF